VRTLVRVRRRRAENAGGSGGHWDQATPPLPPPPFLPVFSALSVRLPRPFSRGLALFPFRLFRACSSRFARVHLRAFCGLEASHARSHYARFRHDSIVTRPGGDVDTARDATRCSRPQQARPPAGSLPAPSRRVSRPLQASESHALFTIVVSHEPRRTKGVRMQQVLEWNSVHSPVCVLLFRVLRPRHPRVVCVLAAAAVSATAGLRPRCVGGERAPCLLAPEA